MQAMFRDGKVPVEIVWGKMVFIPKWKGDYRGIGLVEVLQKVCAGVVNCWIKRSVVLHNALHRFRTGIGTGMVTLESKLDQELAGLAHEPLFQVLLDV